MCGWDPTVASYSEGTISLESGYKQRISWSKLREYTNRNNDQYYMKTNVPNTTCSSVSIAKVYKRIQWLQSLIGFQLNPNKFYLTDKRRSTNTISWDKERNIINLIIYLLDNFISNAIIFSILLESGIIWVNKLTQSLTQGAYLLLQHSIKGN